jgi:DNA-binding beta-propeller fold protein YncE
MTRIILLFVAVLALGAGASIAAGDGGRHHEPRYEVWTVDKSNSAGKASGGTLYVYDPQRIESPERIDLGSAAEARCLSQTGSAPVRPHMLLFNRSRSHSVLSYVASGHVLFVDAKERRPLGCIDVGAQAHAAVPSPDERYVLVANQNGKLLQRIRTDYRRFGFITLRGGGLFVVDARATSMRIVAEYDKETVHGNGCGGLETAGKMYVNSGGGTAANLSEFDVYSFPLWKFSHEPAPPNTPAPKLVLSQDEREHADSHGATLTRFGRYLWVADRMGNRIVVIGTWTDELANEIPLVGPLSTDPSPDLLDSSPRGDRVYVSLRGSIPLSGDPHASTGNTPGLCVIKVTRRGRGGRVETIARISNMDGAGIDRADPHALRVRDLSPRWGG